MNRFWISLIVILPLLISACGVQDAPAGEVVVATFTSTPLLDMDGLAERTYTPTFIPTATKTPILSATATEVATETVGDEMASPSFTPEAVDGNATTGLMAEVPEGSRYFVIQEGAIVGMPNWSHQDAGCNWLGVAGQVFDLAGDPVLDLIVEIGGTLEGQPILGLSLTGMATIYGPGGYEIQLADHAFASQGKVWIQIKDDAGQTLSGQTFIETFDDCDQNLLLINFVEVEEIPVSLEVFIPLIISQGKDQ
ncbi:MAG: hypothetical protein H8D34_20950 [Chloroflexi bacterium]|nr:hypothetical protein [Chloroflexota bacterium]